jgi:hypothetical protein
VGVAAPAAKQPEAWPLGLPVAVGVIIALVGVTVWGMSRDRASSRERENEDARDRPIPIPVPRPDDYDECTPEMKNCEELEKAGAVHSFESAVDWIRTVYPGAVERETEREVTERGHCPRLGTHSQLYDGSDYAGSITCCLCCEFRYGERYPDVKCFVGWPR